MANANNLVFRGGIITWSPLSSGTSSASNITLIITQRYAWSRSQVPCTQSNINNKTLIGDTVNSVLICSATASQCTLNSYSSQQISTNVYCTDINVIIGMSSGSRDQYLSLKNNTKLVLAFQSNSTWLKLFNPVPAGTGWSLPVFIDLTQRAGIGINHSPTSVMSLRVNAPIITATTINIPMDDADNDVVRCRWAQSLSNLSGVIVDECAGACNTIALPTSAQLITSVANQCKLNVTLPSVGYYVVAIQIEDFNSTTSTTALSSVPFQFVIYGFDSYNTETTCTTPPSITKMLSSSVPNGGNITVTVGTQFEGTIIGQTGCSGDTNTYIANFITNSPSSMRISYDVSGSTSSMSYVADVVWTPTIDQVNSTFQFCAITIDVNGYSSDPYCVYLIVLPQITTTTVVSNVTTNTGGNSTTISVAGNSSTTISAANSTNMSNTTVAGNGSSSTSLSTPAPIIITITGASTTDYGPTLALSLGIGIPLALLLSGLVIAGLLRSGLCNHASAQVQPAMTTKSVFCQTNESDITSSLDSNRSAPDYISKYINKNPDTGNELSAYDQHSLYYPSNSPDSFASASLNANTVSTVSFSTSNTNLLKNPSGTSVQSDSYINALQRGSVLARDYLKQRAHGSSA